MGSILIEWLEDVNLLTKKLVKSNKSQHNVYSGNDKYIIELENKFKQKSEILTPSEESKSVELIKSSTLLPPPLRLPSIVPPKLYTKSKDGKIRLGGYLLNDIKYSDDLILKNYSLDKQSIIKDRNILYEVINKINNVGYKINTDLLNFINMNPEFYTDSLLKPHPLQNEKGLTKSEKKKLQQHMSKLELQNHIFSIADLLSTIPEFFFINRIDNRGRVYCVSEYLNYQSTELAKSLLLFSRPNDIHRIDDELAIAYFKSYGANCFGGKIAKTSLFTKVKWVDDNSEKIINYENGELIQESENKFLFTAFCIEFKSWWEFFYHSFDTYFKTYFPIQLDASCNGFQHLVLLSGEVDLHNKLNLSESNYHNQPNDFYSYVLEEYKDFLNNIDSNQKLSRQEIESYERIKTFFLDRKLIKKMIMTIPYNATTRKMVDDVATFLDKDSYNSETKTAFFSHPKDSSTPKKKLSYKDLYLLVNSMRGILDNIAPRVTRLKQYLHQIATICTILEIHIPWVLPSGLIVQQSYLKEKSVNIKPFTYSNTKIKLKTYTKQLDLSKQTRAFMPNLIHSLDATSLMLLLHEYFNNPELGSVSKNIYTIHDCFGMNMNHVEFIIDNLRKVYIKLYSSNSYLIELDKYILEGIKAHYRNVSLENGKLNIIREGETLIFDYPNIKEIFGEDLPSLPQKIPYIIL